MLFYLDPNVKFMHANSLQILIYSRHWNLVRLLQHHHSAKRAKLEFNRLQSKLAINLSHCTPQLTSLYTKHRVYLKRLCTQLLHSMKLIHWTTLEYTRNHQCSAFKCKPYAKVSVNPHIPGLLSSFYISHRLVHNANSKSTNITPHPRRMGTIHFSKPFPKQPSFLWVAKDIRNIISGLLDSAQPVKY